MKRAMSPDYASEAKRFDGYMPPSQYQQQRQQMHIHQQQQIMAQQHIQAAAQQHIQAAAAQQQQQQFQMQQQQQFTPPNQSFYNQPPFFPLNSVNMNPFNPTPSLLYNNSPTWNFMSTPPPFFTPPSNAAGMSSQPPLPPPEMNSDRPPLPKDPEPALGHLKNEFMIRPNGSPCYNGTGSRAGIKIRGVNSLNGGLYNGFNGGHGGKRGPPLRQPALLPPNGNPNMNMPYSRNRRRNPHHFPTANAHSFYPRMDMVPYGEYNDQSHCIEEDQPAGPEKLTIYLNEEKNGPVQVNKKAKRKPMSTRYSRSKQWLLEDAKAALALEKEYSQQAKRQMLILKFPDPDLSKYIVKKYSPSIESVHFQQPSTPRYCFVQLKEGSDTAKVLETIRQIPFGTGTVGAEVKNHHVEERPVLPEEIDPYTLYIGNLPTAISVKSVKTHFPNAQRIDIGYAQKMRYSRYAFIRYNSVEEAMKAYRSTVNALLESRSLIVRFRRQKGNIGLPGETKSNQPPREGRAVLPSTMAKPWDDADELPDDFHEEDNVFLMDDVYEDEEDVEEEDLHTDQEALRMLNSQEESAMPTVNCKQELQNKELEKTDASTTELRKSPEGLQKTQKNPQNTAGELQESPGEIQNTEAVAESGKKPEKPKENLEVSREEPEQEVREKTQTQQKVACPQNSEEFTKGTQESQKPTVSCNSQISHLPPEVLVGEKSQASAKPTDMDFLGSLEEEDDTKENVLENAKKLMQTTSATAATRPKSESPDVVCTDPPEAARRVYLPPLKLEHSGDDSSSDEGGLNLLGTRVKEESTEGPGRGPTPTLDDIYLDDYEYDDMDEEPEEEDNDWADTAISSRSNNWDELRRRELHVKEDKPDVKKIPNINETLPTPKEMPIVANLEPKNEFDRLFNVRPNPTLAETDDLHDMFSEMNSDIDDDDDDDQF